MASLNRGKQGYIQQRAFELAKANNNERLDQSLNLLFDLTVANNTSTVVESKRMFLILMGFDMSKVYRPNGKNDKPTTKTNQPSEAQTTPALVGDSSQLLAQLNGTGANTDAAIASG